MIVQGDNGTRLRVHIVENNIPVDLNGAEVDVKINAGLGKIYTKTAEVTDIGICEVELTSDDVSNAGVYVVQATVRYSNGYVFSSDIQHLKVGKKI